jgi:hypothetical protein
VLWANAKHVLRKPSSLIGISILVALAVFIFFSYFLSWEWTGFPEKRLFAWIPIGVSASIPVAVAIGTYLLNQAAKRREEDAEKRAQEWALLREFHRELSQAYNEVKKVKRMLRAKKNNDVIDAEIYADLIQEELNGVQLHFELLREEAEILFPTKIHFLHSGYTSVSELLHKADEYLKNVVEEDNNNKSEKGRSKSISKLSRLQEFIRTSEEQASTRPSEKDPHYGRDVSLPVREVSDYVLEQLS